MENHQRPAKRRIAEGSVEEEEDRISELPEPILQNHILSLLPQKHAVQTSILSKSWRHLGPTRPKIEFCESDFPESKEIKFLSVVENTLQRYVDLKLPIHELILEVSESKNPISLLNQWIPIVFLNLGVKVFRFSAERKTDGFPLPPVVFQSEFLEELFFKGCKLDQIFNSTDKVQVLNSLRTLSLRSVWIEDENFEKIVSRCPLIEHLVLDSCYGLRAIKVNKAPNLKHLDCVIPRMFDLFSEIDWFVPRENGSIEINDAPSLETIRIFSWKIEYELHSTYFSTRLKSLYLWGVHLPTELLNNLSSNNCPCLEKLELHYCFGFTEFKLSNRSIKHLIFYLSDHPIKAVNIDVANILYFEFRSSYLPSIISFATTSREWKSRIEVWGHSHSNATSFLLLNEFLKALSQSQIFLDISNLHLNNKYTYDIGGSCEPVVVEHLCLKGLYSFSRLRVLLYCLFRICRPRYIGLSCSQKICERQLVESIWKTLVKKGEKTQCHFWQQDLEESSIQVLEENAQEWRPRQVCEFSDDEEIRFRLKWRDFS